MFGYITGERMRMLGCLIAALVSLTGGQHVVIAPQGPQIKTVNSGIIFTCTIVEYSPLDGKPEIKWKGPDNSYITATSGRVYVERYDTVMHRLYISKINQEDAGKYTCETEIDGDVYQDDTNILIYEQIKFDDSPVEVQYEIGANPLLPCSATGQPEPTISWRFNRRKLPSNSERYKYEPAGLRLYHLSMRDAGFYECRAEVSSQGMLKVRTIQLDVLYPPAISRAPLDTEVVKGHSATLTCMAHGNPEIKHEWFREQAVQTGVVKLKVKLAANGDTYTIDNVQKEDEGKYFCKVSNLLGSKESHADVKMLVPPVIDELPHKVVPEGRAMIMTCEARGIPEPEIAWLRVGQDNEYTEGIQADDARVSIDNSKIGMSKLIIHDVQRTYSGLYTCIARNKVGEDRNNGTVTVEFKPTLNTSESEKYGWEGERRNFSCVGFGLPLPTMNWFRDGNYISANGDTYDVTNERSNVVTSTLSIHIGRQPWIYGVYNCIAKNQYGYVTKTFHLKQAQPPDMPRNVSVMEETPHGVVLSAGEPVPRRPDELPMTMWKVTYERANRHGEEQTLKFKHGEILHIEELRPNTAYNFYLYAGNQVGYGKAVKFRVRTPRKEPKEKAPADVPGDPDGVEKNANSTLTEEEEEARRKEQMKGDDVEKAPAVEQTIDGGIGGNGSLGLVTAICIGLAVLIILIILIAVCVRRRKRRSDFPRLNKHLKKAGSDVNGTMVMVNDARDADNIQLAIRRVDSDLPDVVAQEHTRTPGEQRRGKITMSSPVPGRAGIQVTPTALNVSNPNTIQKRAWDHMLMHQAIHSDEEEEMEEGGPRDPALSPLSDLPPPPDFLLQNEAAPDNSSYHDVIDGYHSEDPVDDDIDNDFGIREPSYHEGYDGYEPVHYQEQPHSPYTSHPSHMTSHRYPRS